MNIAKVYAPFFVFLIVDDNFNLSLKFTSELHFCFLSCSDLELKPHGSLKVTIVKATDLKNMEMIGKSDPYVVLYIRPLFKVKTKVINNNLNPVWDQTFELIAEDKETQSLILEVLCCSLLPPFLWFYAKSFIFKPSPLKVYYSLNH